MRPAGSTSRVKADGVKKSEMIVSLKIGTRSNVLYDTENHFKAPYLKIIKQN